jgi:hypothetical protein
MEQNIKKNINVQNRLPVLKRKYTYLTIVLNVNGGIQKSPDAAVKLLIKFGSQGR